MSSKHMLVLPWVLLLQITALACCTITLVGVSYADVLTAALVFTLLAAALLILPFRRGGKVMKIVSVIHALPTIYVVLEFLRRVPHVF
ncbi:hypothetical protein [Brevifollis gellanilyticus]|nr:hypothetical protein [Brevifollis gellanilyticus]